MKNLEEETIENAERIDIGNESTPKKILNFCIKFLLPVVLTVLLLCYMFSKVSFADMMQIIRQGVDYRWILLAMILSIFSHIFRAARWRLQLRSLNINPPFMALCCSIFGCYALNLIFPRLGEIWRCTYIAQRQKASFSTVFGSMMADRLFDTLTVFLLTCLTFVVATKAINSFLAKYPIGVNLLNTLQDPVAWIVIVACIALGVIAIYFLRNTTIAMRIRNMMSNLWKGFAAVAHIKGRMTFLFLTLCIWGCYFIQLYVAFFAFSFTADLCSQSSLAYGFAPCLVTFVFSALAMAIPANGGLGPWNIAVMFGLAIYGVSDNQGQAFSMLQWSGQTVMLIILGIFTMIYIAASSRKINNRKQSQ